MSKRGSAGAARTRWALRGTAAALLIARAYRWRCPLCQERQSTDGCTAIVSCTSCLSAFRVRSIHHRMRDGPIPTGTAPDRVFLPGSEISAQAAFDLERGAVRLVARGYQWACYECAAWCERPQHVRSALTQHVTCARCRAHFPVGEVRHWDGTELRPEALTRHALVAMQERAPEGAGSQRTGPRPETIY